MTSPNWGQRLNGEKHSTPIVIPNLFRDNTMPPPVILKQVQDDEWFKVFVTTQLHQAKHIAHGERLP
jgi:hypothetical protein